MSSKLYSIRESINPPNIQCIRYRGIQVYIPYQSVPRAIQCPPPSLKSISILTLVETWVNEFKIAINDLQVEMKMVVENKSCHNKYACRVYKYTNFKDVIDDTFLYFVDLHHMREKIFNTYVHGYPEFYSNKFRYVVDEFIHIFHQFSKIEIDSLNKISVYIERTCIPIVKILQLHHKLMYILFKNHANPIRPRYYDILGLVRERIHRTNRYQSNKLVSFFILP